MTQKLLSPYKKGKDSFDQSSGLTPVETPFSHLPISQCAICHLNNQKSDPTKFNAKDNGDENSERCLRCGIKLQWFEEYGTNDNDIDNDAIIVDYEDVVEEEDDSDENDLNEKEELSGDNEREDSDYSDGQEYDEDEDLEEEDEEDDMDEGLDILFFVFVSGVFFVFITLFFVKVIEFIFFGFLVFSVNFHII
ncbi:hypothetical protein QCA50_012245 [Cerrena zonata]|uniref:Uncharacterized protein n=1 Tax=Cerrena zonata TaxID=2478898 RepID=A0AAW0FZB2_9APHY